MKRQMVAALYEDENFTERVIKKHAINWRFPKNENGSQIFVNKNEISLIDGSQKVGSRNPSPECNYREIRLANWKMR